MSDLKVDLSPIQFNYAPGDRVELFFIVEHPEDDDSHSIEQQENVSITIDNKEIYSDDIRLREGSTELFSKVWTVPDEYERSQVAEVILSANTDDDSKAISITNGNEYTRVKPSSGYDGGDMDPTLSSVHKLYGANTDGTTFTIGSVENTDSESQNSDTIEVTVNNSVVSSEDVTLEIGERYDVTYSPNIDAYDEDTAIPITLSTGDSKSSGSMRILKSRPFTDNGEALVITTAEPESWSETTISSPDEIGPDTE